MSRLEGPARPPLVARLAYWFSKRKIGKVAASLPIYAHHPRQLKGYARMEFAQEGSRLLSGKLKHLAQLVAASRIGCPF